MALVVMTCAAKGVGLAFSARSLHPWKESSNAARMLKPATGAGAGGGCSVGGLQVQRQRQARAGTAKREDEHRVAAAAADAAPAPVGGSAAGQLGHVCGCSSGGRGAAGTPHGEQPASTPSLHPATPLATPTGCPPPPRRTHGTLAAHPRPAHPLRQRPGTARDLPARRPRGRAGSRQCPAWL